jgi:hypothetical protein
MIPEPEKMRNTLFLIFGAQCLLVILLAITPVSASPAGSPAVVTISASPPAGETYNFDERILFNGTNTDSGTTYLFLTGPGLMEAGSQIDNNNLEIAPVANGVVSTFRTVSVGADNQWSWTWDTRKVPLSTGTYTVYAVSTPRDKNHLETAIYDSVAINFTEPALSASAKPAYAGEGETVTISGTATGHPQPGVAIWVIGPEYSGRTVVEPDFRGRYSYEIDSTAIHLLPGNYHVFVEHPSTDGTFDFDLNGDYLFNNRIRSNVFTFRGNGRLYGEAAYAAFSAAVNGPKHDDMIVPVSFTLGTAPAAPAITPFTVPVLNATVSPVNGTMVLPATPGPANPAEPAATSSSPVPAPLETVPAEPGNDSVPVSPPAGNTGGGLPYGTLAGIFGIVVLGGAAVAVFLTRRRTGMVPENLRDNTVRFPPQEEGPAPMAGTMTPATVPALPVTNGAGDPALQATPLNAFPEELAGKYTRISPIGSGGFAMVYSAYRISDDRKVAVKIPIRSNERTGRSFLHEIRVWETMHHPNIVEVMSANILPVPYVEMEFVPGSLENVAKPVPVALAARMVLDISEGIRYAHARRCIHRDIKPQNILLTDEMVPKITDWGISKVLEENARKTTVAGFSLSYAAPEQIAPETFGSTDERTDIYQIGAVFYELVTGLIPFDDESMMEMVSQITTEDPILPSDISPDAADVEKIILKCLAKDKNDRYQSAGELLDALREYLDAAGWGLFEDES